MFKNIARVPVVLGSSPSMVWHANASRQFLEEYVVPYGGDGDGRWRRVRLDDRTDDAAAAVNNKDGCKETRTWWSTWCDYLSRYSSHYRRSTAGPLTKTPSWP
jgi:uncharacterized protein YbjT (DUF2867 family)